jgi:valine--pyruvate aminotransferase
MTVRREKRAADLLAQMLRDELGWEIEPQNIALTNGSQSAFFYLFNLFAGRRADGTTRKVLFPLTPEYIGYADPAWKRICLSPPARISNCCRKASLNTTSILSICRSRKRRG